MDKPRHRSSRSRAGKARGKREQSMERIRSAAIKVFSTKGFDGASIREIARTANVSDALIHTYFGRKDALWRSVAAEYYDTMHKHSDAALMQCEPADELDEMRLRAHNLMEFLTDHSGLHALIAPELRHRTARTEFLVSTFYHPRFFTALRGIEKAQAAGHLPSGNPALLNILVVSLASTLAQRAGEIEILTGKSIHDKELQEEFWGIIEALIFRRDDQGTG